MTNDKLAQYIAMVGGFLGALYLALQSSGIDVAWLSPDKLNAWGNLATTLIPLALAVYGVYKNQYLIKSKAKAQEKVLKRNGMK